jgi:hypothetical protein
MLGRKLLLIALTISASVRDDRDDEIEIAVYTAPHCWPARTDKADTCPIRHAGRNMNLDGIWRSI